MDSPREQCNSSDMSSLLEPQQPYAALQAGEKWLENAQCKRTWWCSKAAEHEPVCGQEDQWHPSPYQQ